MSTAKPQNPATTLKDLKVLVIDDEDILAWSIENELKPLGADVARAGSLRQALEAVTQFNPDVAITDLRLPDGNGLELLKKWRFERPDMPVILITAHGAIDSAVTALRLGAFDYLQKPFNMKDLIAAVHRSSEMAKLREKVRGMQAPEAHAEPLDIIGDTAPMIRLKDHLGRIAKSKANTALILGASGTGKELAARAVHEWSERKNQPFVEINCASIPETLLESELFGYEKGAFTDARERKLGLFEIARNGSIFLDEIGEMPMKLQAKLLRALESRRFKRLGGTKDIEFSGRIIAATNRNLLDEVHAQRFRADLYYRLNVLPIYIPSLAERADDIPRLVKFFLGKLASELDLKAPSVTEGAIEKLKSHPWPGNVRELKNVLQRALVFYEPTALTADIIELDPEPVEIAADTATAPRRPIVVPAAVYTSHEGTADQRPATPPSAIDDKGQFTLPTEGVKLEELEKSLLLQALERSRHNQTKAAQLLGISRHTLRYRLEKHGLVTAIA